MLNPATAMPLRRAASTLVTGARVKQAQGLPVFDTMIGFPHEGFDQYDSIRKQTNDADSRENLGFQARAAT